MYSPGGYFFRHKKMATPFSHEIFVLIIMINGNDAENLFNCKLLQTPTVKPWKIKTKDLIKVALQSKLGRRRLEYAKPFLRKEYGINVRYNDAFILEFDWSLVPASEILDRVFGIDFCFSFLGYIVAIDVTVNPEATEEKLNKQRQLRKLYQAIGIDKTAVCLVQNQGKNDLKTLLKQIIRGAKVIQLAA